MYSAAFNRSNNLFCAGRDVGFRVSDGQIGQGLQLINDQSVFDSRFSPDGTLLVVGNSDSTARLYGIPAAASEPTNTFIRDFIGHSQPVMSVDFSPNGKLLATSAGDGTARLWNTTNGAQVRVFENGGGTGLSSSIFGFGVGRARFSADGKTLLTSSNSTLRFWRISDGKLLLTYTNVGNGVIAVSPDGKHFAYGTGIGAINETNTTVYLARMPLFITEAAVRTNAFQLEWQGGTGLYHVEQRTNGVLGPWQVIAGPMTNTNLSVPLTNGSRLFRVQSVDGPP